ncbi:peptidase A24 [Shewanella sp. 10N.286.52.C2]|uniref:A24 family peptidase n=1 Tax=unclassified Shewanella TaxID=196818 RepID=UPI000C8646D9|nr:MULTISPECIES: A24 family peptidase [unclassified Shewanella]MDO6678127.1 A24 family peptidase [Shewanella sp. 4_MG-2023]PMG30344.1 peptidase A24 [Shewanella sp. 10N.286.52.C2]
MSEYQLLLQLCLAGLFFLIAIASDLATQRIPNLLCLIAIFTGFAINGYYAQLNGLLLASFGFGLAFLMLFPVFVIRVLGAGDVKLMMGIGALMGPELLLWSILYGIVAGSITSLLLVVWRTGLAGLAKTLKRYWDCIYCKTYFKPEMGEAAGQKVPYAPALAIGWAVACSINYDLQNVYIQLSHYLGMEA